jgi:hypothetical protein
VGFIGSLSGLKIEAYYDAYGYRVRPPRADIISRATLTFRVDVSSLPYQSSSVVACSCDLPGMSVERDDAIIRTLERESRVVRAHEQMVEEPLLSNGAIPLPPIRDVTGHWVADKEDEMVPIVYSVHLTPYQGSTRAEIQVEAQVTSVAQHPARAEKVCRQIMELIGCPGDRGTVEHRKRGR